MCLSAVTTQIVTGTWDRGRKEQPWLSANSLSSSTRCTNWTSLLGVGGRVIHDPVRAIRRPMATEDWRFRKFLNLEALLQPNEDQLEPLNKGISFPLSYYRPLAREIYNLLERYPSLKHSLPCYKSTHSPLEKCEICHPFDRFIPKADEEVFPIESLANNKWLISVPDIFHNFRKPYSNNCYLFMTSFLWCSVLLFGIIFNKLWKWKTVCCWNLLRKHIGLRGTNAACGSWLVAQNTGNVVARGSRLVARGSRLRCGSRLAAQLRLAAPCSMLSAPRSVLRASCVRYCSACVCSWELVGTYGNLWEHVETCENLWELVGVCGNLWELVGTWRNFVHGSLWKLMATCGNL